MKTQEIVNLVKNDKWMMDVLYEAQKLNLPDWMIGAGFLRNKVWDYLHNIKREVADTRDIDLIYFDIKNADKEADKKLSEKMSGLLGLEWEIRNQAYMHTKHDRTEHYKNAEEGLSEWVETPTCVAVTLENGEPKIIAPYGIDDLVNLIIRPTAPQYKNLDLFWDRIKSKKWLEKWPKLKVVIDN